MSEGSMLGGKGEIRLTAAARGSDANAGATSTFRPPVRFGRRAATSSLARPVLRSRYAAALLAFASTTALTSPALAQVGTWTGSTSSDWLDSGNWSGNTLPTSSNNVRFNTTTNSAVLSGVGEARNAYVGNGSAASLTITGQDAALTLSGQLQIGPYAAGTVSVLDGATVTVAKGVFVNVYSGNSGELIVSGAGTRLTAQMELQVGKADVGTMTVSDGAVVTVGSETCTSSCGMAILGGDSGGKGTLSVSGAGSSLSVAGEFLVGWNGSGAVTIADGGQITSQMSTFGANATASASVLVTGADSLLSTSDIYLGQNDGSNPSSLNGGSAVLTIANGATVKAASGISYVPLPSSTPVISTGTVYLAYSTGSTATLNIGAAEGSLAQAAGTLDANYVTFGNGTGTVVFNHTATDYAFGAAFSGTGSVKAIAGTTILSGDSSGFTGTTTIGAGATLQVGDGATSGALGGAIVDNGTLIFDRSDEASFAGTISGEGLIDKSGSGTLTMSGNSSSFAGTTTVSAGELKISGWLGGVVTTQSGSTLSGSGTVGGIVAEAGSTIAPGNSPGTLTVAGNYEQQSGSTYAVEVQPGSAVSDVISVQGSATLEDGAILDVTKYGSGAFAYDAHYTVLTAAGGVEGTYVLTGDTMISAFYGLEAVYDDTNVYLDAGQVRSFVAAGVTRNQRATASGLQSLGGSSALRFAIASLPTDAEARAAFDALSGEVHASIKGALVEDSGIVREAAIERLRHAFGSAGAATQTVAACGEAGGNGTSAAPSGIDCPAVWAQGYGSWGTTSGNGNASELSHDIGGFLIGADAAALDTWRLGVMGGYSRSTYSVDARDSSGNSDNYSVGVYGGSQWDRLGLRLGAAYTWSDVETARSVNFAGFADSLSGDYDAGTTQVFVDLGYRIDIASASFEPFAGLAYVNVDTDGFTEQGGAAALTSQADDTSVTFLTLGLRASNSFTVSGYDLTVAGTLGWRHGWGDLTPTSTLNFAGSDAFAISGTPIAADAALVEAGISAALSQRASLDLSYSGQFGDGVQSQGVRGTFGVTF
ncbi:autotransporter outer membrane beta-barrel domain-containing protein [Ancylobacter sp.]|uniref:autotransporter outer membrane beta-barrel domain-containing protein n=1 Tax=Ancylobacter sp. TaxID=1872567 RepID=UPI003D0B4F03